MTLADQISVAEAAATGKPYKAEDMAEVVKSLRFLAKYEMEIRAAVPAWMLAREVPVVDQVMKEFPGASTTVNDK